MGLTGSTKSTHKLAASDILGDLTENLDSRFVSFCKYEMGPGIHCTGKFESYLVGIGNRIK